MDRGGSVELLVKLPLDIIWKEGRKYIILTNLVVRLLLRREERDSVRVYRVYSSVYRDTSPVQYTQSQATGALTLPASPLPSHRVVGVRGQPEPSLLDLVSFRLRDSDQQQTSCQETGWQRSEL